MVKVKVFWKYSSDGEDGGKKYYNFGNNPYWKEAILRRRTRGLY
jgi:hypothetical protein